MKRQKIPFDLSDCIGAIAEIAFQLRSTIDPDDALTASLKALVMRLGASVAALYFVPGQNADPTLYAARDGSGAINKLERHPSADEITNSFMTGLYCVNRSGDTERLIVPFLGLRDGTPAILYLEMPKKEMRESTRGAALEIIAALLSVIVVRLLDEHGQANGLKPTLQNSLPPRPEARSPQKATAAFGKRVH